MSKTWLITGSARGLGRFIVEAALAAGDNVLATARDPGRLDDLKAVHGDRLASFMLDVTDMMAAQAAVEAAVAAFGRLDVLVNNAGFGHLAPFEQASEVDFRSQIDTNFYGVVNLSRAALPVMRRQRAGHIIQLSSVGGRMGTPGMSAYQAAKWAVGGFTEVLAKETAGFGVKVVAVEPGGMRTDWGYNARGNAPELLPEYQASVGAIQQLLQHYVGHEIGDPAKVAQVIVDLTRRESVPTHLLLGSDAQHVFNQADAVRRQEAEAWADVTRSTDFDGTDLSILARLRVD
ncbi:SDR family NAD(P)-dependent oxidoreductase [Dyella sp.]|uniref:SDR family NAD(P)-dependent oxidoreductase n=1 Tax=Dyella sp. TaxID=1869338 RepID=UPI002ED6690F